MTPFHDNVLIKITNDNNSKTSSGIIISSQYNAEYQYAEVVAVGPGMPNFQGVMQATSAQVGDQVIFAGNPPTFTKDGEVYAIMRDSMLQARVD